MEITRFIIPKDGKRYNYPVRLEEHKNRIEIYSDYNKFLINEFKSNIKDFDGVKWLGFEDPPKKCWSILNNPRNRFQLAYLGGLKPYARFMQPLLSVEPKRKLYTHQTHAFRHALTYRTVIIAAEPGLGKTLVAFETAEASGIKEIYWIGSKSAIASTKVEMRKWRPDLEIYLYTYDAMKKLVEQWQGDPAPRFIVFDEAHALMNPTTQRSKAAMHITNAMREEYAEHYILEMTGTPAPKNPTNWWHLCEVACPGFLKEGTLNKFRNRLAIIVNKETQTGGVYPELVTWRDNTDKCDICGKTEDDGDHDRLFSVGEYHEFVPMVNEIERLYHRMQGLVIAQFKKDCLKELPDKLYKRLYCEPNQALLNAAELIKASAPRVITALINLRELSDGFQYKKITDGKTTCKLCHGTGEVSFNVSPIIDEEGEWDYSELSESDQTICPQCGGDKVVDKIIRKASRLLCPKDDLLRDILDEHEEIGRLVIYAGFRDSVERCLETCVTKGWEVTRVDGRGWFSTTGEKDSTNLLEQFQDIHYKPKIAYVAHPMSGGEGVTLTASPTIVHYSNDFNGKARMQSDDRIHRPGMDLNKGATIIDLINLPSDEYVLENLLRKQELQSITMGQFQREFNVR